MSAPPPPSAGGAHARLRRCRLLAAAVACLLLCSSSSLAHTLEQPEAQLAADSGSSQGPRRRRLQAQSQLRVSNAGHGLKGSTGRDCSARGVLTIPWALYMKWQSGDVFTVPCGATLEFEWPYEPHGVVQLKSFSCPKHSRQSYERQLNRFLVPGGQVRNKGRARFKASRLGPLFFACQVYGHCFSGQIIRVNVVSAAAYKGPLLSKSVRARKNCRQDTGSWKC